jgi:hypothetical protein
MREYGLNSLGVMSTPGVVSRDGAVQCDFSRDGRGEKAALYGLADLMQLGKETGLLSPDSQIVYSGAQGLPGVITASLGLSSNLSLGAEGKPDDPTLDKAYTETVQAIVAEGKSKGWPPFIFIPVDEMDNGALRHAEAVRWLTLLRKAGVTTGATLNGLWFGQDSANSESLRGLIDVRLLNFVDGRALSLADRAEKPVWLYNVGASPWEPKRTRLVFGLYAARCRAAGCFQWAYQWPAKAGVDPYHEMGSDAHFYAQSFAYPAPDGPLPTIALEAIRQGIDDMRYIYTLTQLIAEARKSGQSASLRPRGSDPKGADAAVEDLKSILSVVPMDSPRLTTYCDRTPADMMQAARWQMALSIMSLQAKTGSP